MASFKNLKAIMKAADASLNTVEQIKSRFKGKTREEARQFLKDNLKDLRSPKTFQNLQKVLQSSSSEDIQKLLREKHKNLSVDDAMKLADILTDDKIEDKLPKYLDDKVKSLHTPPEAKPSKRPKWPKK